MTFACGYPVNLVRPGIPIPKIEALATIVSTFYRLEHPTAMTIAENFSPINKLILEKPTIWRRILCLFTTFPLEPRCIDCKAEIVLVGVETSNGKKKLRQLSWCPKCNQVEYLYPPDPESFHYYR